MDSLQIALIDSEQYFKRKDFKTYTWFALSVSLLEDPDFFDISGDEFKAFFYIICLAAKSKKDVFCVHIKHASYQTRVDERSFLSCLNKLHGKRWQIIENTDDFNSRSESVQITNADVQNPFATYIQTNTTNKQTNIISSELEISSPRTPKVSEVQIFNFLEKTICIKQTLLESWVSTYGREFVEMELKKAHNWALANSNKAPKSNWGRFLNNWLSSGWERYRKTLGSQPAQLDAGLVAAMLGGKDA